MNWIGRYMFLIGTTFIISACAEKGGLKEYAFEENPYFESILIPVDFEYFESKLSQSNGFNPHYSYSFQDTSGSLIVLGFDNDKDCDTKKIAETSILVARRENVCTSFLNVESSNILRLGKMEPVIWVRPQTKLVDQKFYFKGTLCLEGKNLRFYSESHNQSFIEKDVFNIINSLKGSR